MRPPSQPQPSQRALLLSAWTGAIFALYLMLLHPVPLSATLLGIAILVLLIFFQQQRAVSLPLCAALGALCTGLTVRLVA